jgi:dihydropyrimidinase
MALPFMGTVSKDDFETGTAAAIAGGTTTIIDFVTPARGQAMEEALAIWDEKARIACCDYGYHMSITWWGPDTAAWMERCVREKGITSFKVFLAYKDTTGIEDADLIRVLETAARLGAVVTVHAEHGDMVDALRARFGAEGKTESRYHPLSRPSVLEGEATGRVISLAEVTGTTVYIVHMTCADAVSAVATARECGQRVYGETCPQYLLLDDSVYEKPDFGGAPYVMSPPIRPEGHQEVLWGALASGVLQTVGTDHCSFDAAQKEMGRDDFRLIPNGAAGIEHRMPLLYTFGVGTGRLDLHRFVEVTSTAAAKIFGLYPRKGSITVGADADLVVWNPDATQTISAATHRHRCDLSIYEGFEVKGLPATVVVNGVVRYADGRLRVEPGSGRYLSRQPMSRD